MREILNEIHGSETSLKLGISLLTVPLYLYWVDMYHSIFVNSLINFQVEYQWGPIAIIIFMVGIALIFLYLDIKFSNTILLDRLLKSAVTLGMTFLSWTVHKDYAYWVTIFWILGIYLLIDIIQGLFVLGKEYFLHLETNHQLMIAIPVITICLNYLLKI